MSSRDNWSIWFVSRPSKIKLSDVSLSEIGALHFLIPECDFVFQFSFFFQMFQVIVFHQDVEGTSCGTNNRRFVTCTKRIINIEISTIDIFIMIRKETNS
jgi:hypothetical protein